MHTESLSIILKKKSYFQVNVLHFDRTTVIEIFENIFMLEVIFSFPGFSKGRVIPSKKL